MIILRHYVLVMGENRESRLLRREEALPLNLFPNPQVLMLLIETLSRQEHTPVNQRQHSRSAIAVAINIDDRSKSKSKSVRLWSTILSSPAKPKTRKSPTPAIHGYKSNQFHGFNFHYPSSTWVPTATGNTHC